MRNKASLKSNQQGIVAIVVTMIIMIVLTLIVVGFAQLARREQREALDRQLSTQAFYAAESGINDARRAIKGKPDAEKQGACDTPKSNLDSQDINQYTCLLYTQKLPDLKFQNVQTNKSTVVPINPERVSGTATNNLIISWQNKDGGSNDIYSGSLPFPTAATWGSNKIGMLRIDLVKMGSSFDLNDLKTQTFTTFLKPSDNTDSGVATQTFTTDKSKQGPVINAVCDGSGKRICYAIINNVQEGGKYYLRMRALYNVADVVICADSIDCNGEVVLKGAQAEIDSTGRANDVLKRMQVRVNTDPSFNGSSLFPEYVLDSSESVCKLISTYPKYGNSATCP